jgi:hypothetical protein
VASSDISDTFGLGQSAARLINAAADGCTMLPIHGIRKDNGKRMADLPAFRRAAMLRPHLS